MSENSDLPRELGRNHTRPHCFVGNWTATQLLGLRTHLKMSTLALLKREVLRNSAWCICWSMSVMLLSKALKVAPNELCTAMLRKSSVEVPTKTTNRVIPPEERTHALPLDEGNTQSPPVTSSCPKAPTFHGGNGNMLPEDGRP